MIQNLNYRQPDVNALLAELSSGKTREIIFPVFDSGNNFSATI